MLTLGGVTELELCDNMDPFSEGIMFSVRPLMKTWNFRERFDDKHENH